MDQPRRDIADLLAKAENILLLTHIHPDGDALGSQLGLAHVLEALGKKVYVYGEAEVSHLYDFLPGCEKLSTTIPDLTAFDLAVALDCGDRYRLGKEMDNLLTVHPLVVIDHHAGHKEFGDIRWVAPQRASTGEMVYDLSRELMEKIPFDAAYCLYAAIVSDTGSFKYSQTTPDTFRIAKELTSYGVKPHVVAGKLFDNFSVSRLELMRMVLDSLELYADNRLAMIYAPHEIFEKTGTTQADTETFINYPRSLDTVKVAAFIKENKEGLIAVSMRSKGTNYDVAQVAADFGGGGHRNAAGFKMNDATIPSVREQLLTKLLPLVER